MKNFCPGTGDQPDLNERIAGVEKRTQQLNAMNAAIMQALQKAPVMEAARERGLLPQFAMLATRVRAVEEQFTELVKIVVEDHTALVEALELLRRLLRDESGNPRRQI